jgi:predicted nucleotidyltransferase
MKECVQEVLRHHPGVCLALLFGSRARGTADPTSDVDVALLGRDLDFGSLARDLSLALGHEVDLVDLAAAGIPLLAAVLRDGVVLYEASPGIAASFRARAIASLEIDLPWFARMRRAYLRRVAEVGL